MVTNLAVPSVAELGFILLAVLVFYASSRRYGLLKVGVFLGGAMLWTALLENFAVLEGGYTYYAFEGKLYPSFPGYLFWVGTVPLWILLGWFVFAMSARMVFHEALLPHRRALLQATAAGLFALNMDLVMDPIASSNSLWVWLSGAYPLIGIPLYNFIGWFVLIFAYDLITEHTLFNNKSMAVLSRMEKRIFGSPQGEAGGLDLRRFVFRIVVLEIVVIAFLWYLNVFLNYAAGTAI